jgi:HEAT repeat protein
VKKNRDADDEYQNLARRNAGQALGGVGPEAIAPLVEALKEDNFEVQDTCADALRRLGDPAVAPLRDALESNNVQLRSGAALALAKLGSTAKEALPALNEALKDESSLVRVRVAQAVWNVNQADSVVPVFAAALEEPHQDIQIATMRALRSLGSRAAPVISQLVQLLKAGGSEVRREAVITLGQVGSENEQTVPALIQALEDSDPTVRRSAAMALGSLGSKAKDAVAALNKVIKEDFNIPVRRAATNALQRIESPSTPQGRGRGNG